MGTFFKPWRRKLGVVALGLACLLMAGWVRSQQFSDFVKYRVDRQHWLYINSNNGHLRLSLMREHEPGQFTFFRILDSSPADLRTGVDVNVNTHQHWYAFSELGFGIDDGTAPGPDGFVMSNQPKVYLFYARYRSIVVPLTLISCWLLLSKPRPHKPHSPPQPLKETAA